MPNGLYPRILRVERQDRIRRRNLTAVIQMGVDVGSRSNIAVPQPFLDFLQADAICVKQAGAAMTKLVEATNGHSLVEAENAICYDIVRGYGLRRSLFWRRGVFFHGTKKQKTSVYRNV